MYNDHEDFLEEVSDYDEDIRHREELIEEAKKLETSAEWNTIMKDVLDLKKRWKRISYWDSAYEETLSKEFDSYIDVFYAKRNEGYQGNQSIKEELIERAQTLATSNEWNKATDEMNELMLQWKATGTAGRDSDDTLWDSFNEARQQFFDRKHEHWKDMQSKFETAREVKQDLIKQAATLADSDEWNKTSAQFKELMDRWKAVGSAGKEHEDQLWTAFNESRQKFYGKRNAYYDQLHEVQGEKYTQKKALVEQAKAITEAKEYTKEHTQQMKQLGVDWKGIGSCGKEKEDQIWKEFRSIMDSYFDGLKQWNDQRHQQWHQRMVDARARKQDMIQNQKRQIKHMQEEMVGLLGQRAIDEMMEDIADKEDFIRELEEDIADIDKTLAKDA